jgi:hypothetical protein
LLNEICGDGRLEIAKKEIHHLYMF